MKLREPTTRYPRRRQGPSCLLVIFLIALGWLGSFLFQNRQLIVENVVPPPTMTPTQSPANLALRARLYVRDGEIENAIETYESVIEVAPDDVSNYIELINLLVLRGQSERALQLADDAIDIAPEIDAVYEVKAAAHIKRGEELAAMGLTDASINEYARAVESGRAATRLNASNARGFAYTASGLIRQDLELLPEAQIAAETSLNLEETAIRDRLRDELDPVVLYYFAEVLQFGGSYESAEQRLEQALQLNPQYLDARLDLARIYFFIRNENRGAINLLKDGLEFFPDDANLLDTLAQFSIIAGNYADAERYAEEAITVNPEMIRAHARLGHAYFKNSNYPRAIAQLREATAGYGEPNDTTSFYFALLGLALYYENVENCTEAVPIFERALAASIEFSPGALNSEEGLELCRIEQLNQP